jgi:hypothetical protein
VGVKETTKGDNEMAALYGRLQGDRGEVTRLGHTEIQATLETWVGEVRVGLEANGDFVVTVGDKSGGNSNMAVHGNVGDDGERGRYIIGPDGRVYTQQRQDWISRFRPIRMTRKVQELYRTHVLKVSA